MEASAAQTQGSGISPGAGSGVPPHVELAACEGQRLFKIFHP